MLLLLAVEANMLPPPWVRLLPVWLYAALWSAVLTLNMDRSPTPLPNEGEPSIDLLRMVELSPRVDCMLAVFAKYCWRDMWLGSSATFSPAFTAAWLRTVTPAPIFPMCSMPDRVVASEVVGRKVLSSTPRDPATRTNFFPPFLAVLSATARLSAMASSSAAFAVCADLTFMLSGRENGGSDSGLTLPMTTGLPYRSSTNFLPPTSLEARSSCSCSRSNSPFSASFVTKPFAFDFFCGRKCMWL